MNELTYELIQFVVYAIMWIVIGLVWLIKWYMFAQTDNYLENQIMNHEYRMEKLKYKKNVVKEVKQDD